MPIDRHGYQREVERLLEQIRRSVREIEGLQAVGDRERVVVERERELAEIRERLAGLISHRSMAA